MMHGLANVKQKKPFLSARCVVTLLVVIDDNWW